MPVHLRPYQIDALEGVEEQFESHRSTIAVMATGLGKTVVFAELLRRRAHLGRAMVLAHREELVEQAAEKIAWVAGLQCDIEMADRRASKLIKAPVVVSSIQTQCSGRNGDRRMHQFDPGEFATVVIDEFHHATADTYRAVGEHYAKNANAKLLGVTATPKRTDQIALGSVCESVAFRMGIRDAIQEGWLVPIRVKHVEVDGLDLSSVGSHSGDFTQRDLGCVMDQRHVLDATVLATLEHSEERKTIVFCASVEQAADMAAMLNSAKAGSAHIVTGETPTDERRAIIDGFRKSRFQYLTNFGVLLEGFDVWDTACIVCARPTKNALLLEQMIGRGTRPDADYIEGVADAIERRNRIAQSEKPDTIIVDFIGNVGTHKPARVIDVLGGKMPEEVRELAEREMTRGCEDVNEAIRLAESMLRPQRELKRGKVRYAALEVYDLFGLEPERGNTPVEAWQIEKLEKWRMPIPDSAEEAQDMIEEFRRRTRLGLCTYRMARTLKRYGYPTDTPFAAASAIIDKLAANGWRRR